MNEGFIFQVKRYSIHDGPGIRTTVFMKGCPLSCQWCHNPESRSVKPELALFESRCILCGSCFAACGMNAINPENPVETNRNACTACGSCIDACPTGAREIVGIQLSPREVILEVERDIPFYIESGGGVTFSGGEPLAQMGFLSDLLHLCRAAGIHSVVDTSCFADIGAFLEIAALTDLMLCDLKFACDDLMREFTGVGVETILMNIRALAGSQHEFVIRIPVIPGKTSRMENLESMADFIHSLGRIPPLQLLPYHGAWIDKARRFGFQPAGQIPDEDDVTLSLMAEFFKKAGLPCDCEV